MNGMMGFMPDHLPPAADRDALLVELVSWHAPEWFGGIEMVLDALGPYLVDAPRDVLLLCERMAARLEVADVDDSDGGLSVAFERLESIHAAACAAARIPRPELQQRLERLAYASDIEAFATWRVTHAGALRP